MKKTLVALFVVFGFVACTGGQNANEQATGSNSNKDFVEILYFHGKQRCITCNAIENLTKEVVNTQFATQLKQGLVVFRVIDISTKQGEQIADKYEVTWSSLYINKWAEGKETIYNMTDYGFGYAKNSPDVFKAGVKRKIEELLK